MLLFFSVDCVKFQRDIIEMPSISKWNITYINQTSSGTPIQLLVSANS